LEEEEVEVIRFVSKTIDFEMLHYNPFVASCNTNNVFSGKIFKTQKKNKQKMNAFFLVQNYRNYWLYGM
jgi:hypothetical protein